MKIHARLVISLTAETKAEAVDLATTVRKMQETTAHAQASGSPITVPPDTDIRWLVKPGVWDRG